MQLFSELVVLFFMLQASSLTVPVTAVTFVLASEKTNTEPFLEMTEAAGSVEASEPTTPTWLTTTGSS